LWFAALVAVAAVLAGTAPAARAACPGDRSFPTATTTNVAASALVCDINEIRVRQGLGTVRWAPRLFTVAKQQAETMASSGTFTHDDAGGQDLDTRVAAAGYLRPSARASGIVLENIAWAEGDLGTPRAIASAWMDSDAHREALLDPRVTQVAIGIASDPATADGIYYAAEFGYPGPPSARHHRSRSRHLRRT
jgi:uncharacterized protein YkwD